VAHTFGPMPTLREFVEKALTYPQIEEGTGAIVGPKGSEPFRYLRRKRGALAILPKVDEEEELAPAMVASLCRILDISPQAFGLPDGFRNNPFRSLWDID